jgi:quercetin dioxygenase-like cupin family protein
MAMIIAPEGRVPLVESWDLNSLEVEVRKPRVLDSEAEGRAIVINLPAGEQLSEHQVHERAWLLVTDGEIEVTDSGDDSVTGSTGLLCVFDPNERHEVTAKSDSRLLLVLSPWPGEGHPSNTS